MSIDGMAPRFTKAMDARCVGRGYKEKVCTIYQRMIIENDSLSSCHCTHKICMSNGYLELMFVVLFLHPIIACFFQMFYSHLRSEENFALHPQPSPILPCPCSSAVRRPPPDFLNFRETPMGLQNFILEARSLQPAFKCLLQNEDYSCNPSNIKAQIFGHVYRYEY